MASATARSVLRDRIVGALIEQGDPAEYIETVAESPRGEDLPPAWVTIIFQAADRLPITIGRPTLYRESGGATLVVATIAGKGDGDAAAIADWLSDALLGWSDPMTGLRVTRVGTGREMDDGDAAGRWYRIAVDVEYVHDEWR